MDRKHVRMHLIFSITVLGIHCRLHRLWHWLVERLEVLWSRVGRTYVVTVGIDSHTPWCRSLDIMVKNRHDLLTDRERKRWKIRGSDRTRTITCNFMIEIQCKEKHKLAKLSNPHWETSSEASDDVSQSGFENSGKLLCMLSHCISIMKLQVVLSTVQFLFVLSSFLQKIERKTNKVVIKKGFFAKLSYHR